MAAQWGCNGAYGFAGSWRAHQGAKGEVLRLQPAGDGVTADCGSAGTAAGSLGIDEALAVSWPLRATMSLARVAYAAPGGRVRLAMATVATVDHDEAVTAVIGAKGGSFFLFKSQASQGTRRR